MWAATTGRTPIDCRAASPSPASVWFWSPRPKKSERGEPIREQILDAAARRMSRQGFHETSLSQIAEDVGIRAPSLLYHFGSKDGLYEALVQRFYAQLGSRLADAAGDGAPGASIQQTLATLRSLDGEQRALLILLVTELLATGRGAEAIERAVAPLWQGLELTFAPLVRAPDAPPARQVITLLVMAYVLSLEGDNVPEGVARLRRLVWGEGDHMDALVRVLLRGLAG